MGWTADQVLAMAPDASAQRAARDLSSARKWAGLGYSETAVWGDCKGGASEPYHTAVDLSEPAFKCTCPSRKFPCKHGLALLLIYTAEPKPFKKSEANPVWVEEWLGKRTARAERATRATTTSVATPEDQAQEAATRAREQQRRAERRANRVAEGVEELRLWLTDLVREGLRELPTRPRTFWEQPSARMVDAQAPGLGRRISEMATLPYSGPGWPPQVLTRAGQLYLLIEAYRHIDQLPADLGEEVRSQLGFNEDTERVLARGERIADDWAVLGRRITIEDKLRVQRTWLWGRSTEHPALILDFSFERQPKPPDANLVPGTSVKATLAFYPGSVHQRALVAEHEPAQSLEWFPSASLSTALERFAQTLSSAPWLGSAPVVVGPITPIQMGDDWLLVEPDGGSIAMDRSHGWQLLAVSGGHPIQVFGEWNGERLATLSAWGPDGFANLEIRA